MTVIVEVCSVKLWLIVAFDRERERDTQRQPNNYSTLKICLKMVTLSLRNQWCFIQTRTWRQWKARRHRQILNWFLGSIVGNWLTDFNGLLLTKHNTWTLVRVRGWEGKKPAIWPWFFLGGGRVDIRQGHVHLERLRIWKMRKSSNTSGLSWMNWC